MPKYKMENKNSNFGLTAFSVALLAMSASSAAYAGINEDIENTLKFGQDDAKYGQIKFDMRLRYENANTEETSNKTADALTARFRIGYLSPEFHGIQTYAEFEANQDIGVNDYRNKRNGTFRKNEYDVIQDPQDTEVNRLWISYNGIADTSVKVGRQRIKLDNDRFIGNIGWRQMEQTFDSAVIVNKSLPNTTATVGYINRVKRIFSDSQKMTSPFINLSYDFKDIGKLTGYGYWLDYDERENYGASSQTYGVRFNGGRQVTEDVKLLLTAEYAHQSDYEHNPNGYDADYYHIIGGFSAFGVTLKGGMEELGGSGSGQRFQTPLATGHAFNGWADVFLGTPGNGLQDVYGSASTVIKGVKVMGVYHDFSDDTGSIEYGNEYDFLVAKKFGKHYSLLAKYSYYDADTFATDRQKFWIQAGVHF